MASRDHGVSSGRSAWQARPIAVRQATGSLYVNIHLNKDIERSIKAEVMSGHFASADEAIAEGRR
jgi:hypothetical protein